jgi:hypothetical protein
VVGVLVKFVGLVLAGPGGFAVWADQTQRDTDGCGTWGCVAVRPGRTGSWTLSMRPARDGQWTC